MIDKTGQLVQTILAAMEGHGATPFSEIRVRVGKTGPEYRIHELVASTDGRDFKLILQTGIVPTGQ